jgi:DNA-binding MarR family transcriptional regulator
VNDPGTKEDRLTLELLDAIEQRSDVSQRHLARQMGVALGLANSYLRRCAKKGLVKIREAPANRYLYYLTPKGFAEKARLTARFLSTSLTFYRQAGDSCNQLYSLCDANGWTRLVLCGLSDLAEIAYVRALESPIKIVAVFDLENRKKQFFSVSVCSVWHELPGCDAYLITDLVNPLDRYRWLAERADKERLLIPSVLGIEGAVTTEGQEELLHNNSN